MRIARTGPGQYAARMPTTRWKIATAAYLVCCFGGGAAGAALAGWPGLALWLGGTVATALYAGICIREAKRAGRLAAPDDWMVTGGPPAVPPVCTCPQCAARSSARP